MSLSEFDKSLSPVNYQLLCKMLKEFSGLHLTDHKMYLVETRLQAVAKHYNFNSLNQLIDGLKGPLFQKLRVDIAEAMATPETFFFRDKKPFDQFKNFVIPQMLERHKTLKRLNIWCGACSSGQEPYSIAMMVDELQKTVLKGWQIRIIASDFSEKILKRAKAGIYSQFEVQRGLPIQYLMKHFKQESDGWHVKDELKRMIEFRNFNLLHSPMGLGKMDVVFCRNVLFYFTPEDKGKILNNIASILNPGAMMFLGSAESTVGCSNAFVGLKEERGIYMKADDALVALSA